MPRIDIDTDKLRVEGENLKLIARDYNNLINNMYDKIKTIPQTAWSGDSNQSGVNQFVNKVLSDKSNMQALANSMNILGNAIINYANRINNSADNNL